MATVVNALGDGLQDFNVNRSRAPVIPIIIVLRVGARVRVVDRALGCGERFGRLTRDARHDGRDVKGEDRGVYVDCVWVK
jgi:hypothetical protein